MIALFNVLIHVVFNRSISCKNGLMLEAFIFVFIFNFFNINVKVQLLHFSLAFPICQVAFVAILDVGIASICDSFDKFLVVLVAQNGNAKGSFLLFSVVKDNL